LRQALEGVCIYIYIYIYIGWRIHESVEDTKLSTNKQHSPLYIYIHTYMYILYIGRREACMYIVYYICAYIYIYILYIGWREAKRETHVSSS